MTACSLDIFCVQPIAMTTEALLRLMTASTRRRNIALQTHKSTNIPEWFRKLYRGRGYAGSLVPLSFDINFDDALKSDIATILSGVDISDISISSCPFYDNRFDYFVLTTQVHVATKSSAQLCDIMESRDENGATFYNKIRALFVKDNEDSKLGLWADVYYKECLAKITSLTKSIYRISLKNADFTILNNTGNISIFFQTEEPDTADSIYKLASECQFNSEFMEIDRDPIVTPSGTKYLFGGRFHTIVGLRDDAFNKYASIQFHMQYIYFYLYRIYEVSEYISEDFTLGGLSQNGINASQTFDLMSIKIESLLIYNEYFKMAIENEKSRIYDIVESKWNIEGLLGKISGYSSVFRDYSERMNQRRNLKSSERMNFILAVIAFIQTFGLISVMSDFIGFFPNKGSKVHYFGVDVSNAVLLTPIIIPTILVVAVGLYMFVSKAIESTRAR